MNRSLPTLVDIGFALLVAWLCVQLSGEGPLHLIIAAGVVAAIAMGSSRVAYAGTVLVRGPWFAARAFVACGVAVGVFDALGIDPLALPVALAIVALVGWMIAEGAQRLREYLEQPAQRVVATSAATGPQANGAIATARAIATAGAARSGHSLIVKGARIVQELASRAAGLLLLLLILVAAWVLCGRFGARVALGRPVTQPLRWHTRALGQAGHYALSLIRGGMTWLRATVAAVQGAVPVHVPPAGSPSMPAATLDDANRARLASIERAIAEAPALAGKLRFVGFEDDVDTEAFVFHALPGVWHDFTAWQIINASWSALGQRVGHYTAAVPDMTQRRTNPNEPPQLIVTLPKPPGIFPSGEATMWRRFRTTIDRAAAAQHPLRWTLGFDDRSREVLGELSSDRSAWLIAGSQGSGKTESVLVPAMASLMDQNSPDQIRFTIIDSVKHELLGDWGFEAAPHVYDAASCQSDTPERIVEVLDDYIKRMEAAYAKGAADHPVEVLVCEEIADLQDTIGKAAWEEAQVRIKRTGQIGRSARFYPILTTQIATANIVPRAIRALLKVRVVGYFEEALDYSVVLDKHARLMPQIVAGRFITRNAVDRSGDVMMQGLRLPKADGPAFVADLVRQYGPRQAPSKPMPRTPPAPPPPVAPTPAPAATPAAQPAAVARFSTPALGREMLIWQAEEQDPTAWLTVPLVSIVERINARGFAATEASVMAAVEQLIEMDVLEEVSITGKNFYQLAGVPGEAANALAERFGPALTT